MTQITADLTDEQRKAIEQVEKLLRLAGKNQNENESAAAAAKAQELLLKHNLDMSIVEQNSGASSGKREDIKFAGGLYHYQRELWGAVAKLNFRHRHDARQPGTHRTVRRRAGAGGTHRVEHEPSGAI